LIVVADVPPWLKPDNDESRPSINSRRKPERRVPITAPPTKPSAETTTTAAAPTFKRERFRPETPFPEVSAAPVFYENHHGPGNPGFETTTVAATAGRDGLATARNDPLSNGPTFVENRDEMVNEMQIEPNARDGLVETVSKNVSGRDSCPSRGSRGILWPEVGVGSVARRPCPAGAEKGQASWECVAGRDGQPYWKHDWPDLSGKTREY
jgi:hypothetical protein